MADAFDPLHQWLGIPPQEQPPHFYRLLGLRPFEDDPRAIENAADRQTLFLRQASSGPRGAIAEQLVQEIAKARHYLLNAHLKGEYDVALRHELSQRRPVPAAASLPPHLLAGAAAPVASPVAPESPQVATDQASASPSVSVTSRGRARPRAKKKMTVELIKIAVGGVAGIAIAIWLLKAFFGMDVLGLSAPPKEQQAKASKSAKGSDTPMKVRPETEEKLPIDVLPMKPLDVPVTPAPRDVAEGEGKAPQSAAPSASPPTPQPSPAETAPQPRQDKDHSWLVSDEAKLRLVSQGRILEPGKPFTLQFWFRRLETEQPSAGLVSCANLNVLQRYASASGQTRYFLALDLIEVGAKGPSPDDLWHHAALAGDGERASFYLDGKRLAVISMNDLSARAAGAIEFGRATTVKDKPSPLHAEIRSISLQFDEQYKADFQPPANDNVLILPDEVELDETSSQLVPFTAMP